jgi:hypothetical protein
MPDYTRFPNATDVEYKLKSSTLWPTTAGQITLAREQAEVGVKGACEEWERLTGYTPFLSSGEVETWDFRENGRLFSSHGILQLGGGLLELTSVTINESPISTDYIIPEPVNSLRRKRPYRWLSFPTLKNRYLTRGVMPLHFKVTGKWGYCTTVPADAWEEVLEMACLFTLTGVENLQSLASLSVDGFNKQLDIVGTITQKDLMASWGKGFEKTAKRFALEVV